MKNSISFQVETIIYSVKINGDIALCSATKKFDKVNLSTSQIRLTSKEIKDCLAGLEPDIRRSIDKVFENISYFHAKEFQNIKKTWKININGIVSGQRVTSIEKAGIYVPGGRYSYPSSVLMTAIPAKIAGVKYLAVATPPGNINPAVIYACQKCGVDEIFRVGGAQAIAAFAFGTKIVPKVDIIVGPGNAYVTEAKRQVFGYVGIDSIAGPSEVAIIADASAEAETVFADLMAQAEHDSNAKVYLFSTKKELVAKICKMIPGSNKKQFFMHVCGMYQAIALVNRIAPEHLELMVKNPELLLSKIHNAGAVFLGPYAPAVLGDYIAGPSHVLPTAGSARFSSGLSCATFMKRSSFINCSRNAFTAVSGHIKQLSLAEGLVYHNKSAWIRE